MISASLVAAVALAAQRKHQVVATCRGDAAARLQELAKVGAWPLSLDVTSPLSQLQASVQKAMDKFGRIDCLVNNSGFVQQGAIEETSPEQTKAIYETNVFGLLNVTRACLPHMRKQRSGTIINISSHCGRFGWGAYSDYVGTKFAVEGITESLRNEVAHLGIKACAISPGDFRTNVLSNNAFKGPAHPISDYDSVSQEMRDRNTVLDGKQAGDPDRLANIIVDLAEDASGRGVPVRLAAGSDSVANQRKAAQEALRLLDEWQHTSVSTDFDQ